MRSTFARSDVGLVRTNNEDAVFADSARGLLVVCDGMGGHAAGEVASGIAIETIQSSVPERMSLWPFGRAEREKEALLASVREANRRVHEAAQSEEGQRGMGTTAVVLWMRSGRGHVAHVGDSRLYRCRGDGLSQLTQDHSWPTENGAFRNVLTRAVGVEPAVEVDYRLVPIEAGDTFLLCSDGLTRTVTDLEILETLRGATNGEAVATELIDRAKANGAPDNVTVALAFC